MHLNANISLPTAFIRQMERQLPGELELFLDSLNSPAPISIRLNPYKTRPSLALQEAVPWSPLGFYLQERPAFTLDPFFHAGSYYVQEASSMLVGFALRQLMRTDEPVKALDLCAAPGGKSTLLASMLPANSLLLCNEVIRSRYQILRENLIKWGDPFIHSAQHEVEHFRGLAGFFDFILVDAPCSGEGLFRRDPAAIKEWSPERVRHNARRQKRILSEAVKLLRPGGLLCYSTCTYNDLENTANAEWLIKEFGFEEQTLSFDPAWGVMEKKYGYQCFPHRMRGEGLYLSCFIKLGEVRGQNNKGKSKKDKKFNPLPRRLQEQLIGWFPFSEKYELFQNEYGEVFALVADQIEDLLYVKSQLSKTDIGVLLGRFKRRQFVPSPNLALSVLLHEEIPRIPLDLKQALRFLKKESVDFPSFPKGWATACYQNQALGWFKRLEKRVNNYYPKEWRIE